MDINFEALGHLSGGDWTIIFIFILLCTVLAFAMRGRLGGTRGFFLANRDLPWVVVCLSLISTEISAASFVGVPQAAYGGSLMYLQLAIGAILARFIIGYRILPAYYAANVSSPYQFIGRRLGRNAESITAILFVVGAMLGQGVRLFILAQVFYLVAGIPIRWTIVTLAALAAFWAAVGGIRSVVYTNLLRISVSVTAALAAAVFIISKVTGGLSHILEQASQAEKLQVFDFNTNPVIELTIWTGLFGATFNTLASHGADQMNTQQVLCCRSPEDARKAMIWSSLSQLFVILMLFVGFGLYAYYQNQPGFDADSMSSSVFPFFIATVMPSGLKGLMIVGLAAAALSSLNAALSGMAETTVHSLWWREQVADERAQVHYSRLFVVLWGAVLCGIAVLFYSMTELKEFITSALRMTSFTYGALAGSLILAFLPMQRDGRGLVFGAPFAVLTAWGLTWHGGWTHWIIVGGVCMLLIGWFGHLTSEADSLVHIQDRDQYVRRAWYLLLAEFPRSIWLLITSALVLFLHFYRDDDGDFISLAWPWYLTMGVAMTLILGYLLARPLPQRES